MSLLKRLAGITAMLASTVVLISCGGGSSGGSMLNGGSSGAENGGSGGTGGTDGNGGNAGTPTVVVSLTDASKNSSNALSPGQPLTAWATVRDANGQAAANQVVTFSSDANLVIITPQSGTALTNGSGVAKVEIAAKDVTASGAAEVTATASVGSDSVSGKAAFSLSAGMVQLNGLTVSPAAISAYGTANIRVTVLVNGKPTVTPTAVQFSSSCASSGAASLPTSVQTVNGIASATYTDIGCAGTDTIMVSTPGASTAQAKVTIEPPQAANIRFIEAIPASIVLKGTGGIGLSEVSTVTFKIVTNAGAAVAAQLVDFSLTTYTGGILLDGKGAGQPVSKQTGADGTVSVTVTAGTNPTPVWVQASLPGTTLASQSNQLTISTGRPSQDNFSVSVGQFNIEGWEYDGVETGLNVIASDRVGNPVPDGTVINFVTEGAQINPASCQTAKGQCAVKFISAERRPYSDSEPSGTVTKGRVSVLAYALGEESFEDTNGNNRYDAGEPFSDLGDIFVDDDESHQWKAPEQRIPFGVTNPVACPPLTPLTRGDYNTAFSVADTCDGVWGPAHARRGLVIVLSGSHASIARTLSDSSSSSITLPKPMICGADRYSFVLRDQNGNPLPSGTTVSVKDNYVRYVQSGATDEATASISLVNDTVLSTTRQGGTEHGFTLSATKCAPGSTPAGNFIINVTTPKGLITPLQINIQ